MPRNRTFRTTAISVWIAGLALLGSAMVLVATSRSADAASISQLQQQIGSAQNKISGLSGQVGAAQSRLSQLNGSISSLQGRLSSIQADLDTKRARLIKLELSLNAARTRLAQLQAMEARGERILTQQVVNNYESDQPDLVTAVLESNGFQDLLERVQFVNRIQHQNTRVVTQVKRDRQAVTAQAITLGRLEQRQQELTTQVLHDRHGLAPVKASFLTQRTAAAPLRHSQAG